MEVYKKYKELNKLRNSYILGFYVRNLDYDEIVEQLEIVKEDLRILTEFKKKAVNGEVKGYGY